jgi:hypothetical protein
LVLAGKDRKCESITAQHFLFFRETADWSMAGLHSCFDDCPIGVRYPLQQNKEALVVLRVTRRTSVTTATSGLERNEPVVTISNN